MNDIDKIAVAALLHDIGKFGQRADAYKHKQSIYKNRDYKYTHAAYTAQILEEMGFNIGDELSDDTAMHHNPQNDNQWIIAAADRIASGFEREKFEKYNSKDRENFKEQRLWYIFDESKRYAIDTLEPKNIFPREKKDNNVNEYDALWKKFETTFKAIKKYENSSTDFFTIDYLMKKFTTFIPSSTSFAKGNYEAVKANIPLYEHSKATAIFAAALKKLSLKGNYNIINYYKNKSADIDQKDLLMISGDFFGIQSFIFNDIPASKASKILRAKSAYIQIFTRIVAYKIVEELGLSYLSVISTSAGKFEILGINDNEEKEKLKNIQKELDDFFIKNFFGQTGIGISYTECSLSDFIVDGQYKNRLRKKIANRVEKQKFKKFNLIDTNPILDYDTKIDNQTLCPLCNKRKIVDEYCQICKDFVYIGQSLANKDFIIFSKKNGQMKIFDDYYISFSNAPKVNKENDIAIFDISNKEFQGYAKWELASYVAKNDENHPLTFEELAKNSVKDGKKEDKREYGIEAIMSLKGDVDGMGTFLRDEGNELSNSFARYNFFSRMIDYFFSNYAQTLMEGKDIYTVFAGGDDIFILGAWDEVLLFAKELREKFIEFSKGSGLTLSVGLVLAKPNKPINFIADFSEKELEKAKELDGKDAISLFGETVKWKDYLDDLGLFEQLEIAKPSTAFTYRLLELIDMSKKVKYENDIKSTMWKSKLSYIFRRNMNEKDEMLLNTLNNMIGNYPKEAKMKIVEFIYKRRG